MKKLSFFFTFLVLSLPTIGQSCLPNGGFFNTQSDIDDFYTNNPKCTTIQGELLIMGNDITNLHGLRNITRFEQGISVEDCPLLENLSGLEKVKSIGGYLDLGDLPLIENLNELSNLSSMSEDLDLINLTSLTNINGLKNVTSAITHLELIGNENLSNLEGINNIPSISTQIRLFNNNILTDISALENIDLSDLRDLIIKGNSQLSECDIRNVCDYLSASIGEIDIDANMTGCNNKLEVETACHAGINELENNSQPIIFPNPAKGILNINYNGNQVKEITIYNGFGLKVLNEIGKPIEIDISHLHSGVYYIVLNTNNIVMREKLIIK